jgi:hypothetical protein
MRLRYVPTSEPMHISVEQLFLNHPIPTEPHWRAFQFACELCIGCEVLRVPVSDLVGERCAHLVESLRFSFEGLGLRV